MIDNAIRYRAALVCAIAASTPGLGSDAIAHTVFDTKSAAPIARAARLTRLAVIIPRGRTFTWSESWGEAEARLRRGEV